MKNLIVEIPPDWKPEHGDQLDAVTDALADAYVPALCYEPSPPEARLIAAAPDLLAALRLFVVAYETNMPPPGYSPHNWRLMREKCRAALARAE